MAKKTKPQPSSDQLIQCWATDPRDTVALQRIPPPALPGATLPIEFDAPKPPVKIHAVGTPEFRFWVAADALRRAADFWNSLGCSAWQKDVGKTLSVKLDAGNDLNAYYSREDKSLSFFHASVADTTRPGHSLTVYSGESPDVLTHELGHAVLDSLKPELWSIATAEVAAFHESFGDMSAILTALQLPSVQTAVVAETQGQLGRNSVVARLAEELGYAIRQVAPKYADADSLRNASTLWLYRDPTKLTPDGPNSELTSEPHNFSRVFTGAFLDALSRVVVVVAGSSPVSSDHVAKASKQMGALLVQAVRQAPLRTRFYQAVAEQLVIAAATLSTAHVQAVTAAMVRRGLLAAPKPASPSQHIASFAQAVAFAAAGTDADGRPDETATKPTQVAIEGQLLGLTAPVLAAAPAVDEQDAPRPVGILPTLGGPSSRETAVQSFIETLARQGRIEPPAKDDEHSFLHMIRSEMHATHRLEATAAGYVLHRIRVDCGCGNH